MKKIFKKLTKGEKQQIENAFKSDIRVKELYLTRKERPLNILEKRMLDQILKEYGLTCKRYRPNYLKLCAKRAQKENKKPTITHADYKKDTGVAKQNIVKVGGWIWSI